jgi:electron transfer flavoprotein beta subunit
MFIIEPMKILVCIKQVATTPDGSTFAMNRFDEYALEEAVRIKEQLLDQGHKAVVDVVSLGRKKSAEVIKRAFGIGADNGFHIVVEQNMSSAMTAKLIYLTLGQTLDQTVAQPLDQTLGQTLSRSLGTAIDQGKDRTLVHTLNQNQEPRSRPPAYDLVLTGMISQDAMEGQTGPILAELMGIACSTGVVKISLDSEAFDITVERELDRGNRENLGITLPVLLTVQAGINTPRYPTLSNLLKAGKKPITTVTVPLETLPRADQTVLRLVEPMKSRSGTFIRGTTAEKADALFSILKKRGVI